MQQVKIFSRHLDGGGGVEALEREVNGWLDTIHPEQVGEKTVTTLPAAGNAGYLLIITVWYENGYHHYHSSR